MLVGFLSGSVGLFICVVLSVWLLVSLPVFFCDGLDLAPSVSAFLPVYKCLFSSVLVCLLLCCMYVDWCF